MRLTCSLAFLVLFSAASAAEPDPKALTKKVVDAAGGEAKLLKLFRVKERIYIGEDPNGIGKAREAVMEPPGYWWQIAGKNARERVKEDKEPATFLVWAWTLGILTDSRTKVETIPEINEGDQPALGLRVSQSLGSYPPMDIYFDKATNLLVRVDWRGDIVRFSDWKDHDGVKYAAKVVGYHKSNGKQWYTSEVTEVERLKELPAGLKR